MSYYFVEGIAEDGSGLWAIVRTFPDALAVAFLWLSTSQASRVTITNTRGEIAAAA